MTGAGTSASVIGQPDLGLMTQDGMIAHARMLASISRRKFSGDRYVLPLPLPSFQQHFEYLLPRSYHLPPLPTNLLPHFLATPLIADADTGYGSPLNIALTISGYMSAGVAALHLEDQIQQKRCGHLSHKLLVEESVWLSRIRAAVMAREKFQFETGGGDIVLIARTDALQSLGYEAAVRRLKGAVELGADVAFLEGVTSKEMARRVVRDMAPTPCLLNVVPGGVTPEISGEEAKEMGFKIVIYPCFALEPVFHSVTRAARELKRGMVRREEAGEEGCEGVREVFKVCGLEECVAFDREAGGTNYTEGVGE
jgi:2-methylisocitrate lyase-like PEP mutase family enzyme